MHHEMLTISLEDIAVVVVLVSFFTRRCSYLVSFSRRTSEHLHSVVSKVHDDDVSLGGDANAARPVKFTGSRSLGTEFMDEIPRAREDLDSVVPRVRHYYVAFIIHGNAIGTHEHSIITSLKRLG